MTSGPSSPAVPAARTLGLAKMSRRAKITISNPLSTARRREMSGLLASLVLIGVLGGVMAVLLLLSWLALYVVSRLEDGG